MEPEREKDSFLLGIGLDGADGHVRVTRGDSFLLCGGSQATHREMQDQAERLLERLERAKAEDRP